MKYAVISDVHGNAPALRLVLEDAARLGADGYLLTGDYCISAPWASEVIALIRSLPNSYIICGNDESHLDVPPGDDGQYEVSRWCSSHISTGDKAWLDALPERLTFECEGVTIHMAHSSEAFLGKSLNRVYRTSTLPGMYPDGPVSRDKLLADFRAFGKDELFAEHISALSPGVYVFGHNHIQTWGSFDGRVLVNPGSCGLPLDCGEFGAAWSMLTIENGHVSVEERRIPYDAEQLIHQVKNTGQYVHARIWSEIIFSEWRTCREKVYQFLCSCDRYAHEINDDRRPFARDTWEDAFEQWQKHAREWYPELFV